MKIAGVSLLNLRVASRLLRAKIVRRHSDDNQPFVFVRFLELVQQRDLIAKNRLAGKIHNEQDFALEC